MDARCVRKFAFNIWGSQQLMTWKGPEFKLQFPPAQLSFINYYTGLYPQRGDTITIWQIEILRLLNKNNIKKKYLSQFLE